MQFLSLTLVLSLIFQSDLTPTHAFTITKPHEAGKHNEAFVSDDGTRFAYTELDKVQDPGDRAAGIDTAYGYRGRLILGGTSSTIPARSIGRILGKTYVSFLPSNSVFYSSCLDAAVISGNKRLTVPRDQSLDPWPRPKAVFQESSDCIVLAFEQPDSFQLDGPVRGTLMRFGLKEFEVISTSAKHVWAREMGSVIRARLSDTRNRLAVVSAMRHPGGPNANEQPIWKYRLSVLSATDGALLWSVMIPNDVFSIKELVAVDEQQVDVLAVKGESAEDAPIVLKCTRADVQIWRPRLGEIIDAAGQRALVRVPSKDLLAIDIGTNAEARVPDSSDPLLKAVLSSSGHQVLTMIESPQRVSLKTYQLLQK